VSPMAGAYPPDPVSTERKSFSLTERKAAAPECQAVEGLDNLARYGETGRKLPTQRVD
jgi:hypothetical protein